MYRQQQVLDGWLLILLPTFGQHTHHTGTTHSTNNLNYRPGHQQEVHITNAQHALITSTTPD